MKTSFCIVLSISMVAGIMACKPKPQHPHPDEIAMVIGDPVEFGAVDYLLFPVGGNYNPEISEDKPALDFSSGDMSQETSGGSNFLQLRDKKLNNSMMKDRSARYEFGNSQETQFDIRNLLFYNKKTGQSYPLVEDTIHILSFAFHYEFPRPLIFYRVVKKDINKDKKFNSQDAVMLYMSDTMGRNFVAVTPENEQLLTYFHYPESNTLLVKTALDIDRNGKFTSADETNFREVHLDKPAMGRSIFSDTLKQTLKELMY